jgi:hypothetical protein
MYRLGTTLRLARAGFPLLVVGAALLAAALVALLACQRRANANPYHAALHAWIQLDRERGPG